MDHINVEIAKRATRQTVIHVLISMSVLIIMAGVIPRPNAKTLMDLSTAAHVPRAL